MYKATYYIITPHAGNAAKGVAMARSPKRAVAEATRNAWKGLVRWDRANNHCSSIAGEVTTLRQGVKVCAQKVDLRGIRI